MSEVKMYKEFRNAALSIPGDDTEEEPSAETMEIFRTNILPKLVVINKWLNSKYAFPKLDLDKLGNIHKMINVIADVIPSTRVQADFDKNWMYKGADTGVATKIKGTWIEDLMHDQYPMGERGRIYPDFKLEGWKTPPAAAASVDADIGGEDDALVGAGAAAAAAAPPPLEARPVAGVVQKYRVFQGLWTDHEVAKKMAKEGKPRKTFNKEIAPRLEELWDDIREVHRERLVKKEIKPINEWKNARPRDLYYLHAMAPNLSTEEAKASRLAPKEYWMRLGLLRDVDSIVNEKLKEAVLSEDLFRAELSDIAFTLYKSLKDNLPDGFKKHKVSSPEFDAIRILQALTAMASAEGGYDAMIHKFYGDRDAFDTLMAESVDQDDFEGLKEVGQGGAGGVTKVGDDSDSDSDSAAMATGDARADSPEPSNNLVTAAIFSDYSFFINNNISKYSSALKSHANYDIFAVSNDIPARMKAVYRSSLVDDSGDKFQRLLKKIVVP